MDAKKLLRIVRKLGYASNGNGKGSHDVMSCTGRPNITWAFHASKEVTGGLVKKVLMKEIGLTREEAKEALRGK
ncbi:type II toxin-antitoxin system HicA family toxin [Paeniglutamicibacter psychrophenolicus]|uniref:type II toxin-antitoxin system HicA family toxin n=1 Tax=Paeniglutamicibacter psychrophenolicus TaxID=257454 RepID=UPI001AE46667